MSLSHTTSYNFCPIRVSKLDNPLSHATPCDSFIEVTQTNMPPTPIHTNMSPMFAPSCIQVPLDESNITTSPTNFSSSSQLLSLSNVTHDSCPLPKTNPTCEFCFSTSPTHDNDNISPLPLTTHTHLMTTWSMVGISKLKTLASFFGHTTTSPTEPTSFTQAIKYPQW